MIYILGVSHQNQFARPENQANFVSEYQRLLSDFVITKNIRFVAEEWSSDASQSTGLKTFAGEICLQKRISYLPCDPGYAERESLGMESRGRIAKRLGFVADENDLRGITPAQEVQVNESNAAKASDAKRESFWLEKIKPYLNGDILFICGHEHRSSFSKLLAMDGYDAQEALPGVKFWE